MTSHVEDSPQLTVIDRAEVYSRAANQTIQGPYVPPATETISTRPSASGTTVPERPARRCGAVCQRDGKALWRVWAPRAKSVQLLLEKDSGVHRVPLLEETAGYFIAHTNHAPGQRYRFELDDGRALPDPCSLWQPDGVHGASALFDTQAYTWTDANWRGVCRSDLVFYELHVGTFTKQGTFEAIIPRLASLRELGVTAIELMPVGEFPGNRDWGYDGVFPYAAQSSYGGPQALQALVNACHEAGLAVFLDVVYNHFGPEGNYVEEFGPYFTEAYRTPWGKAVNFDGPDCDAVRDFVLDNARMWLEEFHFDGLRLDAVHAIYDHGARHILESIKEVAEDVAERSSRAIHIVAESDLNDPRLLWPRERGGYNLDAQWSDDFHHAAHAFFTGERQGYYADFGSAEQLAKAYHSPYLFAGDYSSHRKRKHGSPAEGLSRDQFVVCLQNHDQVGNRAYGERLATLLRSGGQRRQAVCYLLLSPYLPLLFMGEEYGEDHPFPFFCSFSDEQLVEAVREGRKREFPELAGKREIPDPIAQSTFDSAILNWSWPAGSQQALMRCLYQDLLRLRIEWMSCEHLSCIKLAATQQGTTLVIRRELLPTREALEIHFNLSATGQALPPNVEDKMPLFSSEFDRYGGSRPAGIPVGQALPYECLAFRGVQPE